MVKKPIALLLCICSMQARAATWKDNPLIDFDRIVFVKRHTYSANHYYIHFAFVCRY